MNHWHLSRIDWLDILPDTAVSQLRIEARSLNFRDGQTVFAPEQKPDAVFILEAGLVRIYRLSEQGEEFTLGYIKPGEVFGELAIFGEGPRESFAQAIDDCTALMVPKGTFSNLIRTVPDLGFSVTKQIEQRFKQIESRAEDLVFLSVAARLAKILLMLCDDFGVVRDDGREIMLRITQAEFATLVGAARPTVNLTFQQFRAAGLVTLDRGHVMIRDTAGLRRIAKDEKLATIGSR